MSGWSDPKVATAERALEAAKTEVREHVCPRCIAQRAVAKAPLIDLTNLDAAADAVAGLTAAVRIIATTQYDLCSKHRAEAIDPVAQVLRELRGGDHAG